jgi:hypothetical protein
VHEAAHQKSYFAAIARVPSQLFFANAAKVRFPPEVSINANGPEATLTERFVIVVQRLRADVTRTHQLGIASCTR